MRRKSYGNRVIAGKDLTNPDFVRLADSFGVFARRATDPDEPAGRARPRVGSRTRRPLIEVKVGEFPDPWRHMVLPRVRG